MNKKQAMAEARKRWGEKADVRKEGDKHSVGWKFAEIGFSVEGQGATWQEAFEAADVRAKHAPEFLERIREALRVLRGDACLLRGGEGAGRAAGPSRIRQATPRAGGPHPGHV